VESSSCCDVLEYIKQIPKYAKFPKILEVFNKVELNIHLFDAIKQILKYAKLLELCTTKRAFKLKDHEMVSIDEVVSAIV